MITPGHLRRSLADLAELEYIVTALAMVLPGRFEEAWGDFGRIIMATEQTAMPIKEAAKNYSLFRAYYPAATFEQFVTSGMQPPSAYQ